MSPPCNGPGRRTLPRQRRTSGAPIAHLGRPESETEFRIRAIMRSAFGYTRIKMESEVKPLGALLDGLNTVTGDYFATGAGGEVEVDRLVSGLSPGTPYHWRVRAQYDLTKTPFQRNGPWVRIPINGWNEAGLRTKSSTLGVSDEVDAASPLFELLAAGPNPAGGGCEVRLMLGRPARVRAEVFDVQGRVVAVLVDDAAYEAGSHVLSWEGRDRSGAAAAAGMYFVRVSAGGETRVRKAIVIR